MPTVSTSTWAKVASKAVQAYFNWSPFQRGKHWLLRHSSRFLITPISPGLWIRATGVSGFEWKAFQGKPGEASTIALFQRLLRSDMTVFDVGANVGYYSLLASQGIGINGRVHAFEATPAVAQRLAENVSLNRLQNVVVNHAAVCNQLGEVELRLHEDDSEGNSLVSYAGNWPVVRVPAITLDEYIAKHNTEKVDMLKIDVEGAEMLVLAGARKLLRQGEPPLVIVESNPATLRATGNTPTALCSQLADFGYRCYGIEQLTHGPDPVWNILGVHRVHEDGDVRSIVKAACLVLM